MDGLNALVEVTGLRVDTADGPLLDGVDLTVRAGETLGIVGASGAGKTTLALALLGATTPGARITSGTVTIAGTNMLAHDNQPRRARRPGLIAYLPQDPVLTLNPAMRVGYQVAEVVRAHPTGEPLAERVAQAVHDAGLPTDRAFLRRWPHQLSGGQQQRVLLAQAIVNHPQVLVLDEPTTGLDPDTRAAILARLQDIKQRTGCASVHISHDLAAITRIADRVAVLNAGRVVETAPIATLTTTPRHVYTAALLAAAPDPVAATPAVVQTSDTEPVLTVSGLRATHRPHRRHTVVAAHQVSFAVRAAECVALVGASGSGKSTIARCLAGLHPSDAGTIHLGPAPLAPTARRRTREQRRLIQLIPQNPADTLDPSRTVGEQVARPARLLRRLSIPDARRAAHDVLDRVRLPATIAARRPGELSGGERQRVAIARALVAQPAVLICDEVTSALDVLVQATIIDLLTEQQAESRLGLLFISHDHDLVATIANHTLALAEGLLADETRRTAPIS
jgi:peptide/nickel transport system ATP-binding protein